MSLECVAILGMKNEPLYLCAPGRAKAKADEPQDVFGFMEDEQKGSGISIRQEVCVVPLIR